MSQYNRLEVGTFLSLVVHFYMRFGQLVSPLVVDETNLHPACHVPPSVVFCILQNPRGSRYDYLHHVLVEHVDLLSTVRPHLVQIITGRLARLKWNVVKWLVARRGKKAVVSYSRIDR